jgi:hypothetical protein
MGRERRSKTLRRREVDDLGPLYFMREVATENGEAVYEFRANEDHPFHTVTAALSEAHRLSAPASTALQGLLLCIEGALFRIVPRKLDIFLGVGSADGRAGRLAVIEELIASGMIVRDEAGMRFNIARRAAGLEIPPPTRQ